MVGLCDCNNFFANCERAFNPALNGRPVVVLSNNDGCIIARSNEAKALGIKMGTPLYQIKKMAEQNNVSIFSSNYQLYGDMSNRVMSLLRKYAPAVEVYSIDEAFLDLSGFKIEMLSEWGKALSKKIHHDTGIPVSIGISPTKTLAKISSKLCKQYPGLHGSCLMYKNADIEKVLKKFPAKDVWGIGRKNAKKLSGVDVSTAWDFTRLSPVWVQKNMSIMGLRTWKELRGEPCIEFDDVLPERQQLCISRSFAKEMTDLESLNTAISTFAAKVAEKLRKQKMRASKMYVFILTNRFRDDMPQNYETGMVSFDPPTDDMIRISNCASEALSHIFRKGYGYKRGGVIVSELVPDNMIQRSLFDDNQSDSGNKELMRIVDSLNAINGNNTIRLASQGTMDEFSTRNSVSPHYTTDWNDLLEVHV